MQFQHYLFTKKAITGTCTYITLEPATLIDTERFHNILPKSKRVIEYKLASDERRFFGRELLEYLCTNQRSETHFEIYIVNHRGDMKFFIFSKLTNM